jgi:PAS domain S-box-containing protein
MATTPAPIAAASPLPDLQRRFELLQAGLDRINQGFTVFDSDLRLVAWNNTFFEELEFPMAMAQVGTPFEAFMRYNAERGEYGPGDVEELTAARVNAARAFRPHHMERTRPNGKIIQVHGEPLPDKGFVTLYTDVTERRRFEEFIKNQNVELEQRVRERTAELEQSNARLVEANAAIDRIASALRQSENRMRLITDSVPALIAYADRDLVYHFVNKGYADWFGHSKEDILGRRVPEIVAEPVFAKIKPHLDRAAAGHQVSYEYSTQRDGRTVHARSAVVPEFSTGGEVIGFFILSFDITEQKQTQAALLQAQKMEAVGQLTAGLAHDFNNLLTIVIGNLATLRERHASDEAVMEFVEPSLHAAHRGVELIKSLLAFSRQQAIEPQTVDVGLLVGNLTQLLRRFLPESIRIVTGLCQPAPCVMADPNRLESAIINTIVNARDAMPHGGELRLDIAGATIGEAQARDYDVEPGDYVKIEISDTGIGMTGETLARSLEPFFSTKPFGSGSGLGLSMVYGFVKQLAGGIRIQSEVGKGTTVAILLPRASGPASVAEPPHAPEIANAPDKALVLLVEDEPQVRRVLRLQLTELGYPVVEANNGSEAVQMLENVVDIGILVTDIVMPGDLDGRGLARLAREQRPELRVVLISGYPADKSGRETGLDIGLPILAKPFTKETLAAAIAAA